MDTLIAGALTPLSISTLIYSPLVVDIARNRLMLLSVLLLKLHHFGKSKVSGMPPLMDRSNVGIPSA